MRSEYPVSFGWEQQLREYEKRLLDLERRSSAQAAMPSVPRVLNDLDDVEVLYDSLDVGVPPVDGEVLTYNAARDLWVPAPVTASGMGGYATARATGDNSPDSWLDWSEASDPSWEPTLYAGALSTDVVGGLVVTEPGFYDVAVVGLSSSAFTIEAFSDSDAGGWQFADEVGEDPPLCRSNLKIMEAAGASEGGASGSIQMGLPADHRVLVRIDTAGTVDWSLSLELVAPADIVDGTCGD